MTAVSKTSKYWNFQFIVGNMGSSQLTVEVPEVSQTWKFRELPNPTKKNKIKIQFLKNIYGIWEVPNLPWNFQELPSQNENKKLI